jgi:SAM-dependent methyltransferase
MSTNNDVSEHYARGDLSAAIERGVAALGKTRDSLDIEDLAAVDEFHIGGRRASIAFLDQLELASTEHVLDVGCGLGGASRFAATRYGCQVTGIDLTADYVETGGALCSWVGLADRVSLHQGSALDMPFADTSFDHAYMMHVGMNIADKAALFAEVARVLKPGASFGVYDVMRIGLGDLTFPVPWAMTAETSAVETPDAYKQALTAVGFSLLAECDRLEFALEFFEELRAKVAASDGPPPLGLHILMGDSAAVKVSNMIENIAARRIAPVEIIARKS